MTAGPRTPICDFCGAAWTPHTPECPSKWRALSAMGPRDESPNDALATRFDSAKPAPAGPMAIVAAEIKRSFAEQVALAMPVDIAPGPDLDAIAKDVFGLPPRTPPQMTNAPAVQGESKPLTMADVRRAVDSLRVARPILGSRAAIIEAVKAVSLRITDVVIEPRGTWLVDILVMMRCQVSTCRCRSPEARRELLDLIRVAVDSARPFGLDYTVTISDTN